MTHIINSMNDSAVNKKVRIKGTEFDRKRKLSDADVKDIQKRYRKGETVHSLAEAFHVCEKTIRWWVWEGYREILISQMVPDSGIKTYKNDLKERAAYKRSLINSGKLSV